MDINIPIEYIPGTAKKRDECGGVTGGEFLDKIFFVSDGVTLSQVREIAGVDGSTIQNWVKRGWLNNTVNKRYSKLHLARILIINMLRETMLLERIDKLLHFINSNLDSREDDIMSEPILYDYICRIIDTLDRHGCNGTADLRKTVEEVTSDYPLPDAEKRHRLNEALNIIIVSYFASLTAGYSSALYKREILPVM